MVQPTARISTSRTAHDVARALETPSEVLRFESMATGSEVVRAFLQTPQWAAIRTRIMGDGRPPTGRPETVDDLALLFRWSADGAFSVGTPTLEERGAYLHCAAEVEAFGRHARRVAPVSPAPAPQTVRVDFVEGLGGERVAVPQPAAGDAVAATGFGEALLAVQAGRHITRSSWAQGTFVTAQAGYPQGIGINANTAAATGLAEGTVVNFPPYLMRCTPDADGRLSCPSWTPDQGDLFARDWKILPRSGA